MSHEAVPFSERLRRKIRERREGTSPAAAAAERAEAERRAALAPVRAALEGLWARLADEPVFARAFGRRPDITAEPPASDELGVLRVRGAVASVTVFVLRRHERLLKHDVEVCLVPDYRICEALGCPPRYGSPPCLFGKLDDLDRLMAAVEERLAEFLAEVCLSPAAGRVTADPPVRD